MSLEIYSFPMSFAQQRLWFLDQINQHSASYTISGAVRLSGSIESAALQHALDLLVERHESLRTTFAFAADGPVQLVAERLSIRLQTISLDGAASWPAAAQDLAIAEARRPFDLEQGPLLRVALISGSPSEHVLLATLHHSIADGWSIRVLLRELSLLYGACLTGAEPALPPLAIQYADFAHWQREWLGGHQGSEILERQIAYWKKQLAAPTTLVLPTDYQRPALQTTSGSVEPLCIPAAVTVRIKSASRQAGTTPATFLLAVFQVLLHRYSGQSDILVGVPVASRTQTQLEDVIGLFVNTLVVRADLAGNPSFRALLAQVHQTTLDAYLHQDVPFEKLIEELQPERSLIYPPLFQVAFTYQEAAIQALSMAGLTVEPLEVHTGTAKFDLTLDLEATAAELRGVVEYNTDLFAPATIRQMIGHLGQLLDDFTADPATPISSHPLAPPTTERSSAPQRAEQVSGCLHSEFGRQAVLSGTAIAVTDQARQLTYAELDRRSSQLAQHLRTLGVGPDCLVGLYLERSLELIVGILGILKAGGAYLPLDPAYPAERLAFMLADSQAALVVTSQALAADLPAERVRRILIDADWPAIERAAAPAPATPVSGSNLAYVIYTSGSTGQPKGVAVTHSNALRLFGETAAWFAFDQTDVWTLFHSCAFDFSVWELWGALLYGGRLVIVSHAVSRAPDAFYRLLVDEQVTVLNQTPSAFRQLIQIEAQGLVEPRTLALRWIIFGGEALDLSALKPWFARHGDQRPRLINMYGITETTVHVTYRPITALDSAAGWRSPIGGAIPDLQLHLLDRYLNPVPTGVVGEIYVGGAGLARGYLGRPALTAERFIPDCFSGDPGARLYKTGDTARRLPDGDIEYLGRSDTQVKIRGFRIELGEIDSVLRGYPGVQHALTLVREDVPGDRKLVAYVLGDGLDQRAQDIRQVLMQKLPDYMVPTALIFLRTFPLTTNGKIDRAALPAPGQTRRDAGSAFVAPRNPTEEILAAVWAKALNLTQVGVEDNFFASGGDSILSLQVLALGRQRGLSFSLQQLFQHPTIAQLAHAIASAGGAEAAEAARTAPFSLIADADRQRLPAEVEDAYPLAMLQAGMLYHMALAPDSNIYHNTDSYHLRLKLAFDLPLFQQAVAAVVARHAVLRTGFELTSYSEPLQLVYQHATIPCSLHDLRGMGFDEQEAAIRALIESEKQHHFDLGSPSLLRFFIHLRSDDSFQFTLTECHAIIDGWSLQSTLVEIFSAYLGLLDGQAPPDLAPLSVSYRDFVALERAALDSPLSQQFWQQQLAGADPLQLPRRQPAAQPAAAASADQVQSLTIALPAALHAGLQQIVKATALPLKSVLLAAHLKVMGLICGQDDVLTGVGMNGRPETLDAAQLCGLFINTVPFRLALVPGSWLDLISATFAAEQAILPFRRYPVAALQQQHGRQPLYEVMFNYLHFHVLQGLTEAVPELEELGAIRSEGTNAALLVHFQYHPLTREMTLDLDYAAERFSRAQIERLGGYYLGVLAAIVSDVGHRHHTFSPLPEAERRQLVETWNATQAAYPEAQCLHQLFERQARQTPEAPALEHAGVRWSYRELDQRANWLAAELRSLGVGPETVVGISMERAPELTLSLLAVLKAGGAYLPLDPALPAERIAFMLSDAQTALLLTQRRLAAQAPSHPIQVLCLDDPFWTSAAARLDAPPASAVSPDNLLYAIYTSGSTGRPKGTLITHRGAVNYLSWCAERYVRSAGASMPVYASIGFDATLMSLFAPLLSGQTAVLLPEEGGITALGTALQTQACDFSLLATTPAHLEWLRHMFAEQPISGKVHTIITGGESLADHHIAYWRTHAPQTRLVNVYGPTETVVASSFYELPPEAVLDATAPIGRPIANTELYVLDRHGLLAPVGTPGELYIGGVGVARGYLNHPALTAERFVPHPWSQQPGARLYRTGDRACYAPDGTLHYLGRSDQQVKIRGFRVEPAEIERSLLALENIKEAVVVVLDDPGGAAQLVAYIVPAHEPAPAGTALRSALRRTLPEYMLPNTVIALAALPVTANGKVDRRALPAPQRLRPELDVAYATPQNELEHELATLWKELLKLDIVGIHDNFFDLGGHSLLVIRLHSLLQIRLGRPLPVTALLQYPTIQALAAHLGTATPDDDLEQSQRRIAARREARSGTGDRSQLRSRRGAARQVGEPNE